MFVILKVLVLLHYSEHCFVVGGCTYNHYNWELSFFVGSVPVSTSFCVAKNLHTGRCTIRAWAHKKDNSRV